MTTLNRYDVKNTGHATRVLHDGPRVITVDGMSAVRNVEVSDEVVQEMHARKDPLEFEATTEREARSRPKNGGESDPGLADKAAAAKALSDSAKALLARADGMQFPEFSDAARDLLGDKWPGGTPKKRAIVEALEDVSRG